MKEPSAVRSTHRGEVYRFSVFVFDASNHILTRSGEEIAVPPRVGAVLSCLLDRAGRLVRKEEILAAAWADAIVTDAAVSQAIRQLRQLLGDSARESKFVQTVHRLGYRFVAPVTFADLDAKVTAPSPAPALPSSDRRGWGRRASLVPWLTGLTLLAALATVAWTLRDAPPVPLSPYVLSLLPEGGRLVGGNPRFGLSPDGRDVVFPVLQANGRVELWHRDLRRHTGAPMEVGEGLRPAFTADGSAVVYFDRDEVRVAPLGGGAVETVYGDRAVWGLQPLADRSMLFTRVPFGGLWRLFPDGETRPVTTPDRSRGEVSHQLASPLPDGRHVLFTIWRTVPSASAIGVVDLETGRYRVLVDGAYHPRLTADGWLLYLRGEDLLAVRFDVDRLEVSSAPRSLGLPVAADTRIGIGNFGVSNGETLAFVEAAVAAGQRRLARFDEQGEELPLALEPGEIRSFHPSPDGRRVALVVADGEAADLWVAETDGGPLLRLTFGEVVLTPRWHPLGRDIVYSSHRDGPFNLFRVPVDGSRRARRLAPANTLQLAGSWSPDGRRLCFSQDAGSTGMDLWILTDTEDGTRVRPLLATAADELHCEISPDGRRVAYTSNRTGVYEINVQSLDSEPLLPQQWSRCTGVHPFWRDASILAWRDGWGHVMSATVGEGELPASEPVLLFQRAGFEGVHPLAGGGFLGMLPMTETQHDDRLFVVVNWRGLLDETGDELLAQASPADTGETWADGR